METISSVVDDILKALTIHHERHNGLPWSIGTITNEKHAATPFGSGVCVTLHGPKGEVVWEKDSQSFERAMKQACDRLDRRIAGNAGA
jgi:hypothetical protein